MKNKIIPRNGHKNDNIGRTICQKIDFAIIIVFFVFR